MIAADASDCGRHILDNISDRYKLSVSALAGINCDDNNSAAEGLSEGSGRKSAAMTRFTLANASAVGNSAGNMPEGNREVDFDDDEAATAVAVDEVVETMDMLASRRARSTTSLSMPTIVNSG